MATPFQKPTAVPKQGQQPRPSRQQARAAKTKTRVFNPSLNVSFVKADNTPPPAAAPAASNSGPATPGTPGAGFHSNEDIHAFAEHLRKQARNRAVERAMDAEQLESTLRHIPSTDGSMAGAWLRARRVSRHAKKIAAAEQAIAKSATALYAQFQAEYESELSKVGKGRVKQNVRPQFQF